jgi:hypothetical protein
MERDAVGLCFDCRHSRVVRARRAIYWLCRLAAVDVRFDKYPRLPVVACIGYEPRGAGEPQDGAESAPRAEGMDEE